MVLGKENDLIFGIVLKHFQFFQNLNMRRSGKKRTTSLVKCYLKEQKPLISPYIWQKINSKTIEPFNYAR
ncbi:MAG TPA: hypothetical protein DCS93_13145 [Microscillaceae bacterium]|nr:hypothetical protein [Microscillaceae bacterium]